MRRRSRARGRCSGTGRWACSRSPRSRTGTAAVARAVADSARHERGRRRRFARGDQAARARRPHHPPVDRRRRLARVRPGPRAARRRRAGALSARTPIFVANWKMHMTAAEAVAFAEAFVPQVGSAKGVEIAIAPPFTALDRLARALAGSNVALAAQNVNPEPKGAFTGEIAPGMLAELGCRYAIVGHSERRTYYGESDAYVANKAAALFAAEHRADRLRRRVARGARGRPHDRRGGRAARGQPRAGARSARRRARDRLRADLGDRHRPHRDARRPRSRCTRSCASACARASAPRAMRSGSSTADR